MTENPTDEHVDFADDDESPANPTLDTLYVREGTPVMFDDKTMKYYNTMRFRKMDPILLAEIDDRISFKFGDQWNPYTGERLGPDPYGPLVFHPDSLIKYYYVNRLNDLWVGESQDEDGTFFSGFYGDAVGAGTDIYIQSRGYNPDRYLFRLPIIDCYWDPTFNKGALVTMGPMLTDAEVREIDEMAKRCGSNYLNQFRVERPSLQEIKRLYDRAVNKKPPIVVFPGMTQEQRDEAYARANRQAVDKLKTLRG